MSSIKLHISLSTILAAANCCCLPPIHIIIVVVVVVIIIIFRPPPPTPRHLPPTHSTVARAPFPPPPYNSPLPASPRHISALINKFSVVYTIAVLVCCKALYGCWEVQIKQLCNCNVWLKSLRASFHGAVILLSFLVGAVHCSSSDIHCVMSAPHFTRLLEAISEQADDFLVSSTK